MIEQTLVLFKPDAMQRGLVGEGISRFEQRGLKIVGMKLMQLSSDILRKHYAHVADLEFYPTLEKFMQSTPIIAMVLEGPNAVNCVRKVAGIEAMDLGTFRGDYAGFASPGQLKKNLVHTSDLVENASEEIARFFRPDELLTWEKTSWEAIFSAGEFK